MIKNIINNIKLKKLTPFDITDVDFLDTFLLFEYHYTGTNRKAGVNLGDYVQTIAVKNILNNLFPNSKKIFFDRDNLINFNLLKSIAIMQGWFSHTETFLPNNKILPIYIGTHITPIKLKFLSNFINNNVKYFEKFTIGCRDIDTKNFFVKNKIDAYLSRCLTLTFPKREYKSSQNKIFIVDIDEKYYKYIPSEILEKAEFLSQRKVDPRCSKQYYKKSCIKYLEQTEKLLEKYKNEASLIITSALHCASPCIAMGIPTVLIDFEENNTRFGSLVNLHKIYSLADLKNNLIDYNPTVVDFEDLKEKMIKNVELTIKYYINKEVDLEELNSIRCFIENYNLLKNLS